MSNKLVEGFIGLFGGLTTTILGKRILVFIISLMPILELRGGLLAAELLGLDPISSYIIAVIGNIIPIPFIVLLFSVAKLRWVVLTTAENDFNFKAFKKYSLSSIISDTFTKGLK